LAGILPITFQAGLASVFRSGLVKTPYCQMRERLPWCWKGKAVFVHNHSTTTTGYVLLARMKKIMQGRYLFHVNQIETHDCHLNNSLLE
jgi:hypothetical protein